MAAIFTRLKTLLAARVHPLWLQTQLYDATTEVRLTQYCARWRKYSQQKFASQIDLQEGLCVKDVLRACVATFRTSSASPPRTSVWPTSALAFHRHIKAANCWCALLWGASSFVSCAFIYSPWSVSEKEIITSQEILSQMKKFGWTLCSLNLCSVTYYGPMRQLILALNRRVLIKITSRKLKWVRIA